MRPMTNKASITTPRFVSAVGGRVVRAGLYTARAGNAGRLTANDADLLGRLLFVVREVHRAIRRAVWRISHLFVLWSKLHNLQAQAGRRRARSYRLQPKFSLE